MDNTDNKKGIKHFMKRHKKGLGIAGGTITALALGYLGCKYIPNLNARLLSEPAKRIAEAVDIPTESEAMFKGVPLSKLDALAKKMYRGIGCSIDQWGFLVFNHKSNRGHQTFRPQMCVKNGELINLGGHFPNQWWSTADEFAKQANELFNFTE